MLLRKPVDGVLAEPCMPWLFGSLQLYFRCKTKGASHAHRLHQLLPSKLDAAMPSTAPDGTHKSASQFGINIFLLAGQRATSNTDDERPLFLRITPGRTLPPVSAPSGLRLWHLRCGQAPVFSWHLPAARALPASAAPAANSATAYHPTFALPHAVPCRTRSGGSTPATCAPQTSPPSSAARPAPCPSPCRRQRAPQGPRRPALLAHRQERRCPRRPAYHRCLARLRRRQLLRRRSLPATPSLARAGCASTPAATARQSLMPPPACGAPATATWPTSWQPPAARPGWRARALGRRRRRLASWSRRCTCGWSTPMQPSWRRAAGGHAWLELGGTACCCAGWGAKIAVMPLSWRREGRRCACLLGLSGASACWQWQWDARSRVCCVGEQARAGFSQGSLRPTWSGRAATLL